MTEDPAGDRDIGPGVAGGERARVADLERHLGASGNRGEMPARDVEHRWGALGAMAATRAG
jgi:hypothetical protein